jgi:hypothetical protein
VRAGIAGSEVHHRVCVPVRERIQSDTCDRKSHSQEEENAQVTDGGPLLTPVLPERIAGPPFGEADGSS